MPPSRLAIVGAVHAALVVAIWLASIVVYSVVFEAVQIAWIAIDLAIVAACLWFVRARAELLGFGSVGARKPLVLAVITGLSIACVLASQLAIADAGAVWADEGAYLATLREGRILRDGLFPFNIRWLVPLVAGRLNVFPVDGAAALAAINFGGLVVTNVLVVLLLVRLRVRLVLAAVAPVFVMCSYLGVYAATNRLVLDPFNYALFALLCHALLRREHWPYFAAALFVSALNSEKAVYWAPVFALTAFVVREPSSVWRGIVDTAKHTLRYCGPALVYLVAIRLYVLDARTDPQLFVQNLHLMGLTPLGAKITDDVVRQNSSFQILWFPFGAFTVFALIAFTWCERRLQPLVLLLLPILLSTLLAHDTQRMVAYAFVVYIPLGYLYLARAVDDLPKLVGAALVAALAALAITMHYVIPLANGTNFPKRIASAVELVLVGGLIFIHFVWFRTRSK